MRYQQSKRQFLKAAGAWNTHARLLESPLFAQSDFFDHRDKVQVKYEMLRSHFVDSACVSNASQQFGYSRESFYAAMEALRAQGVVGLADGKRGPKTPRKLTAEVQHFLRQQIQNDPSVSCTELAERVRMKMEVSLHRRSIERFRRMDEKKTSPRFRRRR